MPSSSHFLVRRNAAYDRYATALGTIFRDGQRIWDPSYALSEDPDIYWKVRLDAVVDGSIERRLHAIVGREWTWEPASDSGPDKAAAEIMVELTQNVRAFDAARKNLAEAEFHGSAFAYVNGSYQQTEIWDETPRRWFVPTQLKDVDRRRIRAYAKEVEGEDGTKRYETEWRFATLKGFGRDVPIEHPEFLIKHVYMDQESSLGFGRGILDSLYFYYRAKAVVLKEGLSGLEKWSRGIVAVRVDGTRDADTGKPNTTVVTEWLDELEKMQSRHALVFDKADEFEVHDAPSSGANLVREFLDYLDKWIIIRIEGSYLPSGGSGEGGAFAQAQTQKRVQEESVAFSRDGLDESITRDFGSLVWRLNRAPMLEIDQTMARAKMPQFRTTDEQIEDPETNVRVAREALAAGINLKREEVYRRIGWEMPAEGDEIVEGMKQPQLPGMPGLDQPGGGLSSLIRKT